MKRSQILHMTKLASKTIIFWEQLQILITANVTNFDVDPYLFKSLKENAKRLEISIEDAIGLGLWEALVPKNKKHSEVLHVAFIQSLVDGGSIDTDKSEDWLKYHLLMGVIRLIQICEQYDGVSPELKETLKAKVASEMRTRSWNYLEELSKGKKASYPVD